MSILARIQGGNAWRNIVERFAHVDKDLAIGVLEGSTAASGKKIAEYAYYNEYGTENIPARPFLRHSIAVHNKEWSKEFTRRIRFYLARRASNPIDNALYAVGELAHKEVQEIIKLTSFTPRLKPATVEAKKRKGHANPEHTLIGEGDLMEAISYELVGRQ